MKYIVSILDENKSKIIGEIELFKKPTSIECTIENEKLQIQANDYFECLIKLREIFEKRGWLILCNGSRYDVYPSSMSRDMGKGIKAYQMKLGKKVRMEDLVNIFEEAKIDKIGTIEEQKAFYNKWLKSFGL